MRCHMFAQVLARFRAVAALCIAATSFVLPLLLGACSEGSTQPLMAAAVVTEAVNDAAEAFKDTREEEAVLRDAASQLPKLGGSFFDHDGNFVVYLTDLAKKD